MDLDLTPGTQSRFLQGQPCIYLYRPQDARRAFLLGQLQLPHTHAFARISSPKETVMEENTLSVVAAMRLSRE